MKLLDEKGKLFGKINVIDLLVLVVIAAVLIGIGVMILGGGGLLSSGESSDSTETDGVVVPAKLTYIVRVTAQREEIAEQLEKYVNISEGKKDQLQHGGKLIADAYVVDFWTEPCRYNVLSNGEIEIIGAAEADAAGLVDICLVVESVVADTTTSEVGLVEVRIGKAHILKTTHLEFANGVVVSCEWEPIA